jgi:hypothetical protein
MIGKLVSLGKPFRADDCGRSAKRRLKQHTTWHLVSVYLKIGGRMVYLWRAVDAEGEVLDVLLQSKRNKYAALNDAQAPEEVCLCSRAVDRRRFAVIRRSGLRSGHQKPPSARAMEEQFSRPGDGSARCNASRARLGANSF